LIWEVASIGKYHWDYWGGYRGGGRTFSPPPLIYAIDLGSCFLGKYLWDYWGSYRGGQDLCTPPDGFRGVQR